MVGSFRLTVGVGDESCSDVFIEGHFIFTCLDTFAVWMHSTKRLRQTHRQTDRWHLRANSRSCSTISQNECGSSTSAFFNEFECVYDNAASDATALQRYTNLYIIIINVIKLMIDRQLISFWWVHSSSRRGWGRWWSSFSRQRSASVSADSAAAELPVTGWSHQRPPSEHVTPSVHPQQLSPVSHSSCHVCSTPASLYQL